MASQRTEERLCPCSRGGLSHQVRLGMEDPQQHLGLPALSMAGRACRISLEVGVFKFWASIRFYNRPSQFKANQEPQGGKKREIGEKCQWLSGTLNPETGLLSYWLALAGGLTGPKASPNMTSFCGFNPPLVGKCPFLDACQDHTGPFTPWVPCLLCVRRP